jgi:excisionase family DNA binding protein
MTPHNTTRRPDAATLTGALPQAQQAFPAQSSAGGNPPAVLLTVPEAMAALRLSRATLYELIRTREIRTVKVGRCRRVPAVALVEYIDRLLDEAG